MSSARERVGWLSPRWLLLAVAAVVFFQFAVAGGGRETAIWIAGLFLGLQMASGRCRGRAFPRRVLFPAALVALILATSWGFAFEMTDTHRSLRLVKFVILLAGVYCVGRLETPDRLVSTTAIVIALVILWQLLLRHLGASPYGSFERPHYLAYFTLLLVPALVYLSPRLHSPSRFLLPLLLIPALDLILNDLTKPLIPLASLAVAASMVLLLLALDWRPRAAWLGLGLGLGAAALCLGPRAVAFFSADERRTIWSDTLHMIEQGDWRSWLLGNGLGSFPEHFPGFSAPEFAYLSLPHNHILEVLYESGGLVVVVVLAALATLAVRSVKLARRLPPPHLRGLALCNLATLVLWFLFSVFAFSVYSAYNLYPLALILGIHFLLEDQVQAGASRDAAP